MAPFFLVEQQLAGGHPALPGRGQRGRTTEVFGDLSLLEHQLSCHDLAEQLRTLGGFCPALSLLSFEQFAAFDAIGAAHLAAAIGTTTYAGMSGAATDAANYQDPTGGGRCASGAQESGTTRDYSAQNWIDLACICVPALRGTCYGRSYGLFLKST